MKENKQMTEQELDNVTAGAAYIKFGGIMQYSDSFDKNGSGATWKKDKPTYRPNTGIIGVLIGL